MCKTNHNSPKYPIYIGTTETNALIDSGSSCNFIDIAFTQKNKIPLIELPNPKPVEGIDGNNTKNPIWFKAWITFKIAHKTSTQRFYAMPLRGETIILGMTWL